MSLRDTVSLEIMTFCHYQREGNVTRNNLKSIVMPCTAWHLNLTEGSDSQGSRDSKQTANMDREMLQSTEF